MIIQCENCGASFKRTPSQMSTHNFCSRDCAKVFTSARMRAYNKTKNPMNTTAGWTEDARRKKSETERARMGECKKNTYRKELGKHEHRRVAEAMLGRPLERGEIVHHINGDKHDNRPENLMIFRNQSEHVKYHTEHPEESGVFLGRKRGDATCLNQ